jgi:hypothetical protein
MTPTCILVTSLLPSREPALRKAAVASWHRAGFIVLSVNAPAEIPALTADHPDVTLVAAPATADKIAGKPVPYIHDMLGALRAACRSHDVPLTDCTVGIINDDIHLRLAPESLPALCAAAQGSVILGPRVDVAAAADLDRFTPTGKETYSVGYDYFVMSGDVLDDFGASPFCIGMPFWDYWLPLMALLRGRTLKSCQSPIALHISHETRWDNTIYVFFHALIAAVLDLSRQSRERDISATGRQFDLLLDVLTHVYGDVFARGTEPGKDGLPNAAGIDGLAAFYDRFQEVAVHHIKTRASTITLPFA